MSKTYDLFQHGRAELRKGRAVEATGPLEQAKEREPHKASIREALGIAYFRSQRWAVRAPGHRPGGWGGGCRPPCRPRRAPEDLRERGGPVRPLTPRRRRRGA